MIDKSRDQITLEYLNNQDRIRVLEQKYNDNIITGDEVKELINLYRINNKIRKKINKMLNRGWECQIIRG